ncbi:MAG: helix-hairpin-helix domain-containing protein [Gammaproteobacteria bacterium]|jgi:competence protein ComEA|nr:ComEA family DNA-binding protein [Pseudomonas sp.]MDY0414981.1 ComEA family DNA-binding protein [Pseudomonas sp.]NLO53203.1 helix-hairpin-helix domain-containing protein [Gammaproteobacteria bacterium]
MRKLMINTILAAALSAGSFLAIAAEPQAAAQTQIVATIDQPRVNINTADIETLARELNGIGAAKARAIVEYREENGSFASVDELIEVKGIGVAIMEKNLHKLTVE